MSEFKFTLTIFHCESEEIIEYFIDEDTDQDEILQKFEEIEEDCLPYSIEYDFYGFKPLTTYPIKIESLLELQNNLEAYQEAYLVALENDLDYALDYAENFITQCDSAIEFLEEFYENKIGKSSCLYNLFNYVDWDEVEQDFEKNEGQVIFYSNRYPGAWIYYCS
jgi:hypothetical protein